MRHVEVKNGTWIRKSHNPKATLAGEQNVVEKVSGSSMSLGTWQDQPALMSGIKSTSCYYDWKTYVDNSQSFSSKAPLVSVGILRTLELRLA
jgi:hypothetical protein